MEDNSSNRDVFSAMQTEKPYKSYRKTVLGRVFVHVLDPFDGKADGVILFGVKQLDETGIVDVWSEREDVFFKKMNKTHFETGNIIEFVREEKQEPEEKTIEAYSDAELKEVINQKWFALQSAINNTKSEAVLYRMKTLAEEMGKSSKIVDALIARLSEVQTLNLGEPAPDEYV